MRKLHFFLILIVILVISGCSNNPTASNLKKVGLLLEDTIDDKGWNFKGYQGLLKIHSDLNVDVYFNEEINTLSKVQAAISELDEKDVNLIFGHGRIFAEYFNEISKNYPHIHFVSFNGEVSGENVTSLHFNSHAMGFFAGMVAAKMTQSNKVGIIAAYSWQPEVDGFMKGVEYQNNTIDVKVDYVKDWGDVDTALQFLANMNKDGIDVYYPAGDGYHIAVIEEVKNNGQFAIGFVSDQSDIGGSTVLTSTVQHVDHLYQVVAEHFSRGELAAGNLYYDFADGVITLGEFSSVVPEEFQAEIREAIEYYIISGKLPKEE
ncbi:BMP family ABC transporter substrate-binding protein [Alkalihalophilus pseudofirmus]|uniref:BMP family ABC transporter substrate-binding protein n=1 Tax=Alkalihalobacterium alkalinitrilicum TaxID=427920 RepID=UPI00094D43FA|nr:BMP family ABC transporter substrate-binding protein [Alkalihalobacterium alkalinitrilicum]OLO40648.1 BMP family ABC transporter substrate-binding protein [Alkalihalophilus pseudofirmus]